MKIERCRSGVKALGLLLAISALCACQNKSPLPLDCSDGVKDDGESDVDCGGGTCALCRNGNSCQLPRDCGSGSCVNHVCATPPAQCSDGKKDGNETGVDCGGGTCAACANGTSCQLAADCISNSCVNHVCATPPAQCSDGEKDGNETGVDCGGGTCAACANGTSCQLAADCISNSCVNHVCATPPAQCSDGEKDGNETGVDCGGGTCAACANGTSCQLAADCISNSCVNHVCATPPAQCSDGEKDGNETGVDCGGGTCAACASGTGCQLATDCISNSCVNLVCSAFPSQCSDGEQDGSETGVDCGGGTCAACANGGGCQAASDCASSACTNSVCEPPLAQCMNPTGSIHSKFVASQIALPMQATDFAVDLDGNGTLDNQLSAVVGIAKVLGADPQTAANTQVSSGQIILLFDEQSSDSPPTTDSCAGATAELGVPTGNPDFSGQGQFTVSSSAAAGHFAGPIAASTFLSAAPDTLAAPVQMQIYLPLFAGPIVVPITGARLQLDTATRQGQLNGAIRKADIDSTIIPAVAAALEAQVQADPAANGNQQLLALFDTGGTTAANGACGADCQNPDKSCAAASDGHISECEVAASSVTQGAFALDVQLFDANGRWAPNPDGTNKDSMSVGFGFTFVPASF